VGDIIPEYPGDIMSEWVGDFGGIRILYVSILRNHKLISAAGKIVPTENRKWHINVHWKGWNWAGIPIQSLSRFARSWNRYPMSCRVHIPYLFRVSRRLGLPN